MAVEQTTVQTAVEQNMIHTVPADSGKVKRTVLHRYTEAKAKSGYDHNTFCGVILAEHVAASKESIGRIGKLWNKTDPTFPKSDKAFDYVEAELTEYLASMLDQLRSGSAKIVANLEPAPF